MLLLAVLFTLSLAQYDCTSAVEAALPSFEKTFSFSASTPTSKISPDAGSIHTVQAYYIKVTHVDDPASLIMQMSSCFNDNTLDADIDIYSVCDTNIAQNRIYSSGISTQCSGKTESPYLLWESNKGNTYYVVVKTRDVNQVGTVHLSNQVSVDTNTNYECNVATDISAFPFTQKGYLSGSIPVMKVECTEPYPMLWYKMKGDGKYYVAHTCSPYTNIDTAIVLVTSLNAGSCKNSKCAKQADDGCSADSLSTILSFKSEVDVDYYIGVYSINGVYGQFQLHIDSLQDSIPAVCEHALPIQKLPFAKTVNVVEAWPYTDAGCTRFPEKYRSVFLTIVGEGKEMVISTCKSLDAQLNTIGVGVEVLSSCDGMQCDMSNSEYGECYTNNYLIKTLTKGQTYIIHAFCKDGPCELTLNVYVKPDDHSDCEHAMVLVDPGQVNDLCNLTNIDVSVHGCDDHAQTSKGLWYKFMHTKSISDEEYTIYAMDGERSKNGFIEFSDGCMLIQCDSVQQGFAILSFKDDQDSQLIFVYADPTKVGQKALFVQFLANTNRPYSKCDTALDIKLPYTALHSFSNSVTRRVCSNNLNAANFYKFSLAYDVPVDISTCFAKTVIDTGVEVSTGCQGASGATCIGSNSEGKLCNHKAAQMSFDAMKGQSYIMTVFNEALAAVNVKQYRIVAFALEIPANSMCSAATVVPHKQFYKQYLVLNRLAFKTELTDIGTTRGLYYLLNTDKAMKVSVDTCSMSTTMDTFILRHSGCVVNTVGDAKISTPLDYIDVMSTVRYSCDVHGTKLNFETVPNKDYYIFVAPYNFDEEGFMEVQFFMDYVDSDQSSNNDNTSSEEDNNVPVGWIVFGVLFYIMCAVVIAVVVVLIILKRKSSANYSSFE